MSGRLSGVAARKPVHVRMPFICASSGMYSSHRRSMRVSMWCSTWRPSEPNWREEPSSTWPERRGCALKATESELTECALLR